MIRYPALFEPDAGKGGFVVTFPDFEWGVTQGETEAEAIEMLEDALAMRAGRVQKAELTRRMGIPRRQIERLLDLQHSSRLEQIEVAFRALNKRLVVGTEDAA